MKELNPFCAELTDSQGVETLGEEVEVQGVETLFSGDIDPLGVETLEEEVPLVEEKEVEVVPEVIESSPLFPWRLSVLPKSGDMGAGVHGPSDRGHSDSSFFGDSSTSGSFTPGV